MGLVLTGSTSGTTTIDATAIAGTGTLTLPTGTDTLVGLAATQTLTNKSIVASQLTGTVAAAAMPAGSVLQVNTAIKTDTFSLSSTTMTDITGMTVNITPSAVSSRIHINVSLGHVGSGATPTMAFRILRNGTTFGLGDVQGSRPQANFCTNCVSTDHGDAVSYTIVDSPSTTSAITYKLQVATQSGFTFYLNRSQTFTDTSDPYGSTESSTITVMEIKG